MGVGSLQAGLALDLRDRGKSRKTHPTASTNRRRPLGIHYPEDRHRQSSTPKGTSPKCALRLIPGQGSP